MIRNGKLILNIINGSHAQLTAEQICLQLKQVSPKTVLTTVYNNLNALYAQGAIRKASAEFDPKNGIDRCPLCGIALDENGVAATANRNRACPAHNAGQSRKYRALMDGKAAQDE